MELSKIQWIELNYRLNCGHTLKPWKSGKGTLLVSLWWPVFTIYPAPTILRANHSQNDCMPGADHMPGPITANRPNTRHRPFFYQPIIPKQTWWQIHWKLLISNFLTTIMPIIVHYTKFRPNFEFFDHNAPKLTPKKTRLPMQVKFLKKVPTSISPQNRLNLHQIGYLFMLMRT